MLLAIKTYRKIFHVKIVSQAAAGKNLKESNSI
jgi:hypothetical protein